ncbi:two-component system chemotaxis sensor kinase CheA [Pseudomonas sp. SJZ079]|uniref:chemotaxis protein CheA n=1 Tax=Pseudomonas sp. SJZ079 TaxID=2572887 RepID=UPI001199B55B|nr:chemotaxis protein CheA [Pseudomonas sp. SJZ079]TWC28176.1 two-component system chemotaxis sensor kinase CheA [Pseudomonas sp. SJZ079]
MSIDLDQALQTFIAEARELLQDMEESLLRLESEPSDSDTLGAIFRAAHTIKGSAGLFGLDPIVSFTHIVEDVLDRLRDGAMLISAELIALLLESGDHMQELVDVVAVQGGQLDSAALARESGLRQRLQTYREGTAEPLVPCVTAVNTDELTQVCGNGEGAVASELWHISLRFGGDVLRNGMDPLSFLRYLNTLGQITSIATLADHMPATEAMDAESCYLGFEIALQSTANKATISEVFDFVRDDCLIHILPPHSKLAEYIELIHALPENDTRLGEILVGSGALTPQELEDGLSEQRSTVNQSGSAAPLGEILVEQRAVEPALVQAALDKQSQIQHHKHKENRFVRVDADKLDELINLVGELVIAGAGANLLARSCQNDALQEATSIVSGLVEEIRDGALCLRMVPIGETFNRFQRVVRDVSHELGKDIELLISGADTELDKTVVEKIGDPLMHLLRNAMDHGIESPEARLAAGKPGKGRLSLNAYHDSGSIVIEIADDGAGLNRERILQKAQERGLLAPTAVPSDQEIYNLIFEAGFSTAAAVTSLSGRGVGMDVVKRNITALRGSVDLDSQLGQGTTVRIRLPLTLAIIDGFLVGVGRASYVVPLDTVQECIELTEEDRRATRERSYLNLRGEVLPLVFLREHFGVVGCGARRENVVVVQCAEQKAGLVVDELQGEFQTVIKPLGKLFSALRSISGSTILGSGEVALILDVPNLLLQVTQQQAHHPKHPALAAVEG